MTLQRQHRSTARATVSLCAAWSLTMSSAGCSLGEGEGQVTSQKLIVADCWQGPFDLAPDFFAAVPYRETLQVRVQHGGDLEEVSDGLFVLVDDISKIQASLNTPLAVGEPPGVRPIGVPLTTYDPNPPLVHMTLYLNRACHAQNPSLYSIGGSVTLHQIFDGDPNEADAAKRLTDAEFSVTVADPRDLASDGTVDPSTTSEIDGYFRFYFQRGQPAQPFP